MTHSSIALGRRARSWLFAPGDSEKKMNKALASEADIVLVDLEDAVAEQEKHAARGNVLSFLKANIAQRDRLWVRINPVQTPHALADLAGIMAGAPGGVMLPKPRGRADVELLDHYLAALEAAFALPAGSTGIIVVATETPEGLLATGSYAGLDRLAAMTWGAEDLGTALGALSNRDADGRYTTTYEFARSMCLVGAGVAQVSAVETMHGDFRDEAGLVDLAGIARRAGFGGMIAIHPAQVGPINAAFTPSDDEIAKAREIVALFEANPTLGTIGLNGVMLDRPHLVRAQNILARVGQ